MFETHKPWNIEKLDIVKKSNIEDLEDHNGEGLEPYEYFKNWKYILPDLIIYSSYKN